MREDTIAEVLWLEAEVARLRSVERDLEDLRERYELLAHVAKVLVSTASIVRPVEVGEKRRLRAVSMVMDVLFPEAAESAR